MNRRLFPKARERGVKSSEAQAEAKALGSAWRKRAPRGAKRRRKKMASPVVQAQEAGKSSPGGRG